MKSPTLKNFGSHMKRVAEASARDDQRRVIRSSRFKASLVADPLQPRDDIVRALDLVRKSGDD